MPRTESVRIRHLTKRNCVATVPVWSKPLNGLKRPCPSCGVIHRVKTIHLWLDDAGTCLVSVGDDPNKIGGVLGDLILAGMPDLEVFATIMNPPTIAIGKDRFEVDQGNRKIHMWKEPVAV